MTRLAPFLIILLAGCGVEGTPTPPDPPASPYAGAWTLMRVSGQPLPVTESAPNPINPNTHIRPGAQVVSGGLGIVIRDSYNALSRLEYCQRWTGPDGITRTELISERVFVAVTGDSLRIDYVDRPDLAAEVARLEGGLLQVTQHGDTRGFTFGGRADGALPACG